MERLPKLAVVYKYLKHSVAFLAAAACFSLTASADESPYDLIIQDGTIVDGTGNARYQADVGIRDGKIISIGSLTGAAATRRVDARGKIVAPGFIDIHSHADDLEGAEEGLRSEDIRRRQAKNIITQGVTTVVVNPDGSAMPGLSIAQQREQLEKGGIGPNVAMMVAHNAIRYAIMRDDHRRTANKKEIAAMQHLARQGMEEGAFGLSSGLEYFPGRWSNTDEVAAVMEVVAPYGGTHISHIRSETSAPMWWTPSQDHAHPPQLIDAVSEIIEIAERTGTRGVVTHMKVRGTTHWGQSVDVTKLMEEAQARGVAIYGDQYPYNSSGSDGNIVFIPDWVFGINDSPFVDTSDIDPKAALKKVLANAPQKENLINDIEHALAFRGGAENVRVFDYPDKSLIGKSLKELADKRSISVPEMIITLQQEGYDKRLGGARLRSFSLHDDDMVRLMQKDWVATSSDGGVALPEDGPAVHARYYGTFPRKIGHFARDRGLMSLEKAVRSATGLPAKIMGLKTRGLITEGMVADITIFDPDAILDQSTFTEPHQHAIGVDYVLIGGKFALENSKPTGALAGKTLWFGKD